MVAGFTEREAAAWGGLLATYARLDEAIDADLRERDGLTHVEFEVLLRLWRAPGRRLRIQELARASILTRSGTSRLVDRLVAAGLLERVADPADGRASLAALTVEGRRRFERAAPRHVALVREIFLSRLTDEEINTLGDVWARLRDG